MRLSANALDQDFDGRANPPFLFNSFIVYEDVRANAPLILKRNECVIEFTHCHRYQNNILEGTVGPESS